MLRALLVLCLVCIAAPALAQEYRSKELADAARDWRRELIDSIPANKKQPNLVAGLRRAAGCAAPSPMVPMMGLSGCGSRRASSPPRTTMRWGAPTTPI